MPKVEFKRVETDEEVENINIKDGQLIYTGTGKTYMDYGNQRIPTGSGGSSVEVDTEMSDTSENAVQNKVIKEYVDNQTLTFSDIYPVGSIYMSINNVNPSTLFGGTWEQIKDTFLLSAGDTYTAGNTGGEATHTLTVNEIPSHRHPGLTVTEQPANIGNGNSGIGLNYSGSNGGSPLATAFAGGGQAHNNMPPYLVVYMWKRTA